MYTSKVKGVHDDPHIYVYENKESDNMNCNAIPRIPVVVTAGGTDVVVSVLLECGGVSERCHDGLHDVCVRRHAHSLRDEAFWHRSRNFDEGRKVKYIDVFRHRQWQW